MGVAAIPLHGGGNSKVPHKGSHAYRPGKLTADEINSYVQKLDSALDLVLITEYFDESLVLLKRRMCWYA